jgi:hypothetical protein
MVYWCEARLPPPLALDSLLPQNSKQALSVDYLLSIPLPLHTRVYTLPIANARHWPGRCAGRYG